MQGSSSGFQHVGVLNPTFFHKGTRLQTVNPKPQVLVHRVSQVRASGSKWRAQKTRSWASCLLEGAFFVRGGRFAVSHSRLEGCRRGVSGSKGGTLTPSSGRFRV